jgi:hypothetical protein
MLDAMKVIAGVWRVGKVCVKSLAWSGRLAFHVDLHFGHYKMNHSYAQ